MNDVYFVQVTPTVSAWVWFKSRTGLSDRENES